MPLANGPPPFLLMAVMLLPGPLLLPVGLEGRGKVSGSCRPSALEAAARRLRCILIRSNSSALKSARISIVLTWVRVKGEGGE